MLVDTIEKVKAISFDSSNLDAYVASLRGLSATQAEVVLSSAGLDKAQKQQILNKLAETNATVSLTSAEATSALTKSLGSKVEAERLLTKARLVTVEQLQAGTTLEVSAAKLQEAVNTGLITEAEKAKIASALGLTSANVGLGTSFKLLAVSIWESVKAMAVWLVTNPVGWAILATGAIAGLVKGYDALIGRQEKLSRKKIEGLDEDVTKLDEEIKTLEELQSKLEYAKGSRYELSQIQSELNDVIGETKGLLNGESEAWDVANAKLKANIELKKQQREQAQQDKVDESKLLYDSNSMEIDWRADLSGDKAREYAEALSWMNGEEFSKFYGSEEYEKLTNEQQSLLWDAVGFKNSYTEEWSNYWKEQIDTAYDVFEETIANYDGAGGQNFIKGLISGMVQNGSTLSEISDVVAQVINNQDMQDAINNYWESMVNPDIDSEEALQAIKKIFDGIVAKNPQLEEFFSNFYNGIISGGKAASEATKNVNEMTASLSSLNQKLLEQKQVLAEEYQKATDWGLGDYLPQIADGTIQSVFGNVDMDKRTIITWSDELKETYKDALESWEYDPEIGSIDTVFGQSNRFGEDLNGVGWEVAFTPILPDGTFLSKETVEEYINAIIAEAYKGDGKVTEDELKEADAQGRQIGNTFVKGIFAGVDEGVNYENNGNWAETVGRLMHFSGDFGAVEIAKGNISVIEDQIDSLAQLNKALDDIQSAYSTVKSAIEEYNEQGFLSVDTFQKLMELEPEYLKYLTDEEGNLNLTTSAMNNYTSALIDSMAMKQIDKIAEYVDGLDDEKRQLFLTKGATDDATLSLTDYIATVMAAQIATGKLSEDELASLEQMFNNVASWADQAKSGIGKGGFSGSTQTSEKNEALDKYLKNAERLYKVHQDETKYVNDLQWALNNLTKTEEERLDLQDKIDEAQKDNAKNRVKDIKHEIDMIKKRDGEDANVDSYYEQIKTIAHEEADRLRSLGFDDSSDEIQAWQNEWWDAHEAIQANVDSIDDLHDAIDNIQSAYGTLQTALEEQKEFGAISVDTLQSLLKLEPQYLNMLIDEEGQIVLNEDAINNCTAAYIDNLAAKTALNLIDSVSRLETEEEQLRLLSGEAQETSGSLWDLVAAQLAVVTTSVSPEVANALKTQIEGIKNMADQAKAGLGNGGLTGFDTAKDKERLEKEHLEKAREYAEKVADIEEDLAEKEADFAERMAEAWKEEHLAQLKDGLEKQKDLIDRYKKNVEVLDFGLEHIEADDFSNRADLISDKLDKLKSYGVAMRTEFDRIANTIPQTGDEAVELANRLEELGSEMRDNISEIRKTTMELQKLNIDIALTLIDSRMSELQSELDNIDRRIEILTSDYKDDYRYVSNVLSMDMLLPVYSEFDKKRREKQRADKALIKTEQETQDKINDIVSKALEQQSKDNAAARAKERANLIKDMEKARQDAQAKLAEAHKDYLDFLEDNELAASDTAKEITRIFDDADIKLPEIDISSVDDALTQVKDKLSNIFEGADIKLPEIDTGSVDDTSTQTGDKTSVDGESTATKMITEATKYLGQTNSGGQFSDGRIEAWCADFVSYVAKQIGIETIPKTASVWNMYDYFSKNGRLSQTPAIGSIVMFDWKNGGDIYDHVGIVTGFDDKNIYTIEGNTSGGKVDKKTRPRNGTILGYGLYAEGTDSGNDLAHRLGLAGENYKPEILIDKDTGEATYIDSPTVIDLSKTDVVGEKQTAKLPKFANGNLEASTFLQKFKGISSLASAEYLQLVKDSTVQAVFGNADSDKRVIIEWSDELKETYKDSLDSWEYIPEASGVKFVKQGILGSLPTPAANTTVPKTSTTAPESNTTPDDNEGKIEDINSFYIDAVNAISQVESRTIKGVQDILNDNTLTDLEKSLKLYNIKNEAGGEASKIGADIYAQLSESYDTWLAEVNADPTKWSLEIYEAYKGAFSDISDLTYNMADAAVQAQRDAANLKWENSVNYIEERNKKGDWELYGDSEYEAWQRVAKWLREEYPNELDKIKEAEEKAFEARYKQSTDWIDERNTYNDWDLFGDSETEAWERVVKWLKEEYPDELDRIKEAERKHFESRKEDVEKSISDIDDYINARNHYGDWDDFEDSELEAIQRQTEIIEDEYEQRLISYDEYIKRLEEKTQRIYSLGQDRVNKYLSDVDSYISARNLYNDWDVFGDSEIEAIKRKFEILDEARALDLISQEEYIEKTKENTQNLYSVAKNDVIEEISKIIEDYEEIRQDEIDSLNFESNQYDSLKTLLQSYYDVTNAVTDAQHEINKELRASQSMYEYLNEDTRELLFNQEDYNILSEELLDIQAAANELQKQYEEDILGASEETIAEITSQYQIQYETMMKQYEIAKAELDVAKKRQKLDNVLAERNVRMFVNGQWQWVANTQDVINAQNELADAENEKKKAETSLNQANSINELTGAQGALATQINYLESDLEEVRNYWADMQELLNGDSDEVASALRQISKVTSPELKRVLKVTGMDVEGFSSIVSESTTTLSDIINGDTGLKGASTSIGDIVTDLQNFATAIQNLTDKINGVDTSKNSDSSVKDTIAKMKANSEKWYTASEEEQRDLHDLNHELGDSIGANYDEATGKWYSSDGKLLYSTSSSKGSSSSGGGSSSSTKNKNNATATIPGVGTVGVKINSSGKTTTTGLPVGTIVHTAGGDYRITGGTGGNYTSVKIDEKHADGTRYTPGGLTALGEEGFEAFITNNGRLIPIAQPTIGNVGAGGIVFNREQMANLRNLWDLSNLGKVSPFVSTSNISKHDTTIDNSIHINGLTVSEKGNEDWINGLRRYVATHK